MIKCPLCGEIESKVIDSRSMDNGIRRRRECLACQGRYTTYERIQSKSIFIVKKDGRREEFDRDKLLTGVRKACEKRPLPIGAIDKLVESIEADVYQMGKSEVTSAVIGDKVMSKLAELDHIAYIRFASVYRDFEDISDLKHAVDNLVNNKTETPPAGQLFLMSPDELNSYKARRRRSR